MGNTISARRPSGDVDLDFSNSATDAFLLMLILSGSALAETDAQRQLIVYLAEHDQNLYGIRGMVSFSINDMPWILNSFDDQKRFMNRVAQGAVQQIGWSKVESFTPDVMFYNHQLEIFTQMLEGMDARDVDFDNIEDTWFAPYQYELCDRHGTLLYENDGPHCFACHYDLGRESPCCQTERT